MRLLYLDIDTTRADHLGCYGYPRRTTPNLDHLAAQGLRLDNCYVSDAPCLPSRASMFLGQFADFMIWVLIAAALIHQPEVLFLDEPLNGLDANAALVFKEIIKRLSAQGSTILFCSHILDVVEKLCPRIIILNEGSIIAEGTPESIARRTGEQTLEEAFCRLTGVRDARESAKEFLEALGR